MKRISIPVMVTVTVAAESQEDAVAAALRIADAGFDAVRDDGHKATYLGMSTDIIHGGVRETEMSVGDPSNG